MPELEFSCTGAHPDLAAAAPTITLRLHITETSGTPVHALALRSQVRIEPLRRRYDDSEAEALRDLFGERSRWGDTLKPVQLAFVNQVVPSFTGETDIDVALSCSYDFDVAANKYLYALDDGEIPLLMLFSGTVFTPGANGFSVAPIPRPATDCPCRCGSKRCSCTSPARPGCGSARSRSMRCIATARRTTC
jgi:hypothetical protein